MTKQNEQDILKNLVLNLQVLKRAYRLKYKDIGKALGVTCQQTQKYITGANKIPLEKLSLFLEMINEKHKTQYTMDNVCNEKMSLEVKAK